MAAMQQHDTNFGGMFILLIGFFGTFVDERDAGTIAYGITHRQPTTLNPLRLNLDEVVGHVARCLATQGCAVLWKHPTGWKTSGNVARVHRIQWGQGAHMPSTVPLHRTRSPEL